MTLQCNKCEEDIKEGDGILVQILAEATKGGSDYAFRETEAVIHGCCDDSLSFTIEADEETFAGDPESACEHMIRKFGIECPYDPGDAVTPKGTISTAGQQLVHGQPYTVEAIAAKWIKLQNLVAELPWWEFERYEAPAPA